MSGPVAELSWAAAQELWAAAAWSWARVQLHRNPRAALAWLPEPQLGAAQVRWTWLLATARVQAVLCRLRRAVQAARSMVSVVRSPQPQDPVPRVVQSE